MPLNKETNQPSKTLSGKVKSSWHIGLKNKSMLIVFWDMSIDFLGKDATVNMASYSTSFGKILLIFEWLTYFQLVFTLDTSI